MVHHEYHSAARSGFITVVDAPSEVHDSGRSSHARSFLPTPSSVHKHQTAIPRPLSATCMETVAVAVQGDCAANPGPAISDVTGADLLALLPRQCLLVTDTHFLNVTNSSLWMDNLYIRLKRSTRTPLLPILLTTDRSSPGMYITGITFQVPLLDLDIAMRGRQRHRIRPCVPVQPACWPLDAGRCCSLMHVTIAHIYRLCTA